MALFILKPNRLMNENNNEGISLNNNQEPLKIDFSQIIVPEENMTTNMGIVDQISEGKVSFGSIATAYEKESEAINTTPTYAVEGNVTYLNNTFNNDYSNHEHQTAGNVFSNTQTAPKPNSVELQRIVQKLDKLEKMINPNSKKSLILWEEDNSFKNIITSIATYANNCDTEEEFPIELFDRIKALSQDVDNQIVEGKAKIEDLNAQAKANVELSEILSNAYISATAGLSSEEYLANLTAPELQEYKAYLEEIATYSPDSEEYKKAEKQIKSKIINLENCVHVTIDLERTTSKGGALEFIKEEISPALDRLQNAYDKQYASSVATEINGDEAITSLIVKKSFAEKVYDTFVRPFANLFKRKNKAK